MSSPAIASDEVKDCFCSICENQVDADTNTATVLILYVCIYKQHALLTLANDGTILAIFADPGLRWPRSVHVTPAGQVLVSGLQSYTTLQVDIERMRKLTSLATRRDGVEYPWSACYSNTTLSIIVLDTGATSPITP
ncbi:uncharacterized protein LOC127836564 isoform X2 [Dreissena polymorpha]|uniref:uncharacterized protein LOC127836564 isoform X2 n=1 Tax=Dreissena polymorpha TaxID=45954 RepID=UPI0022642CBB|nr:uncharacterized protein LOC127836564 isoform X2 [Dreissena polymorpha]